MAGFPPNIRQIFGQMGGLGGGAPNLDPAASIADTSEQVRVH